MRYSFNYILLFLLLACNYCIAQEEVRPLTCNAIVQDANVRNVKALLRTTAITDTINLPFFDDFSGNGIFPDQTKWTGYQVYVNNTMCVSPPSKGVATLDAIDEHGLPYDTTDNSAIVYADSLSSLPIDMSTLGVGDSVYLSFFYQPQGRGFYPTVSDSLILFLHKNNNDWVKAWSVPGSSLIPFQQVMIPINDTAYFYKGFQFRFVNISAFNYSGSMWNIDYVRMDKFRNMNDTAVNDVSFVSDPTYLLNDYTSMPYRQFLANATSERAASQSDTLQNYTNATQSVPYGYVAKETGTGTALGASPATSVSMNAYTQQFFSFPTYTTTVPLSGIYNKVVFQNTYYLQSPASDTHKQNDTVMKSQVFDNYLAYDDGTAEKSYFLNMFPLLPAYVAIEFHLNQPDTMQGMAIYFGRQVPIPTYKNFALFVNEHLQGINGSPTNDTLYWQDMNRVGYRDTVNHFWIYKFDKPVPLPAGTFYAGLFQPAFSGSDSIYFGLDVNRVGGNHAYYNVLSTWNSSGVQGAIMMRPLLGQPVKGTGVEVNQQKEISWSIAPNPATTQLVINAAALPANMRYEITDVQGRAMMSGTLKGNDKIPVSSLSSGTYFISILQDKTKSTKKFIKE